MAKKKNDSETIQVNFSDLFGKPKWADELEGKITSNTTAVNKLDSTIKGFTEALGSSVHTTHLKLDSLNQKVVLLMALVQIDQTVLDEIASDLQVVLDEVTAIVDNPDVPLGDADVSGITEAVNSIQAKLANPTTPVDGGDGGVDGDGGETPPADV